MHVMVPVLAQRTTYPYPSQYEVSTGPVQSRRSFPSRPARDPFRRRASGWVPLTVVSMHRPRRLMDLLTPSRRDVIVVMLFTLLAGWAVLPGKPYTGPGSPLQFTRGDLSDTKVIGLTVDSGGRDLNAENVRRYWVRHTPTWLNALILRSELGEGQPEARHLGLLAAKALAVDVETPRAVHPGRVTGTSAGLAWSLAALSARYPSITSGGTVAATGSLTADGEVLMVGGLEEKMATPALDDASVILVPLGQTEAALAARRGRGNSPVPVAGVRNVREALGLLCVLNTTRVGPCGRYLDPRSGEPVITLAEENAELCNLVLQLRYPVTCRVVTSDAVNAVELRSSGS